MPTSTSHTEWEILAASAAGSSHVRRGIPNQDSHGWRKLEGQPGALLLAVADGHGSSRSFRSAEGSRLAVEACLELLAELGAQLGLEPTAAKRALEVEFPLRCVNLWRRKVGAHLAANPFPELGAAAARPPDEAAREDASHVAYGTTLLATIITPMWGAALQLGDGDQVWLGPGMGPTMPTAASSPVLGDETDSLCSRRPESLMRVSFRRFDEGPPEFVLLATDGYSKSFSDPLAVVKAAEDIHQALSSQGRAAIAGALGEWLKESASDNGSGDDTTVLIGWLPRNAPAKPPHSTPTTP